MLGDPVGTEIKARRARLRAASLRYAEKGSHLQRGLATISWSEALIFTGKDDHSPKGAS
jgi:hypothetical protein